MNFDHLPLPSPDSDFIGGDTPRSHRSHVGAGYTLDQMKYNCRLSQAKELRAAAAGAVVNTPIIDAQKRILDILR